MCLGVPMQVIETGFGVARCRSLEGLHNIDMSLVSDVAPGDWVMTFLGSAREVISEEVARKSQNALLALELVMRGETEIDHLFQDLLDEDGLLEAEATTGS